MATKTLKTITVNLIGVMGDQIAYEFADTADDPIASHMLDSFRREDIMHGVTTTGNKELYIPFHAVDNILIEEQTADVPNRPDPYGCDTEENCEVAFSGTLTATKPSSSSTYATTDSFDFADFSHNEIRLTINGTTYTATKVDGQFVYSVDDPRISVVGHGGETSVTDSILSVPEEGTYSVKIEICE